MGCKCSSRVAPVVVVPEPIISVKPTDQPDKQRKPTRPAVEPADIDYDRLIDSILRTQNEPL